jgi:hypothetical protein
MQAFKKTVATALAAGVLMLAAAPLVADWRAQLDRGGQVTVDPESNRATVTRDGVTTPLWDGVHRLQDGSVITVRSGQVVPNEDILRARDLPALPPDTDPAEAWVGQRIVGESPCQRLVARVCGDHEQCQKSPACDPAHQLLDRELGERTASRTPDAMTYTSGQCMQADRDRQFFKTCDPQR